MKKWLSILLACMMFITSSICASADEQTQYAYTQYGYPIMFNSVDTGYSSLYHNNTHYVPLRGIFEKLGAAIFYRSTDRQIIALSRDGDIIRHIVGSNTISVNNIIKYFEHPSVLNNDSTYISIDMLATAFCTDRISYDNQQLNIQKYLFNNEYHKIIKDVLDVCRYSNFYPEKFQRYINYHEQSPDYNIQEVLLRVNLDLDYPFYENITTIEHPYELLILVNKQHKLPSGFHQYNLVQMDKKYTVNDGKEYLLAGVAYDKYVQMAEAANREGLAMRVLSAYRTEDYQANLYNNKVASTGKINADNYSARPGHSEHQTGLAVDISSTNTTFEYSAEFMWLQQHAHEYGFILRYPKNKEWITGYSYEPWHYRYVGTDVASIIHQENITYEEFYVKYISQNEFR